MTDIFTASPITWTIDTVNNANTFNLEIRDKFNNIITNVVDKTTAQTLTNKTLTSPVINTPTGNFTTILSNVYPIGCIYTTIIATNPATVFGFGTWVAFGAGKVLVGLNAAETEFDTVAETGGEKTHTLITAEMPAHVHHMTLANDFEAEGGSDATSPYHDAIHQAGNTGSTGGGGAHQNLQPYIVVYFFKRTA